MPELVAIAVARRTEFAVVGQLLYLAGIIELERHRQESPRLPKFLEADDAEALQLGAALAAVFLSHVHDDNTHKRLVISQHSFEGRRERLACWSMAMTEPANTSNQRPLDTVVAD